jgi:hypothetical protein
MTDEPTPGDDAPAAVPDETPTPAPVAARPAPAARKSRKPGSGQHRQKVTVDTRAEETAAAKAAAEARRRAAVEAAAERARLAAERARRHRRNLIATGVSIGLVVVVVAVFVVVKVTHKTPVDTSSGISAANPTVVSQMTSIPRSVFDKVGDGGVPVGFLIPAGNPPALTQGGLPRILYVGALYCPFCATERWPMVAALARFGTFTGLTFQLSSATDSPKDIHSFGMQGVTYTSTSLVFTPVETENRNRGALETPTAADEALFATYDASPTLPQGSTASQIPFIDIGNRWIQSGAGFNASDLEGFTWQQIASASATGTGIGADVDGAANWLTAAICELTSNKPAAVCSDPMIANLEARLPVA